MKLQKLFGMVFTLVLTLVLVSSAHAIQVCYDYALYRAAQLQRVLGCDLTPPPTPTNHYLDAATLKTHLQNLGYVNATPDGDPIAFGKKVYNEPGTAERFLKPGDVMLLGGDHVGFAVPSGIVCAGVCIDHFIMVPEHVLKPWSIDPRSTDHLPAGRSFPGPDRHHPTVFGGLFLGDTVNDFLHKRPTNKAAKPVEVYRPQTLPAANAGQLVCGQVFAGTWSTFGGTGTLGLQATDAAHGEKLVAFYSDGSANCGTGNTYYFGTYSGSTDSGVAAACTDDIGRQHLMGWYKSRARVRHGAISIAISSCLPQPPLNGCGKGSMFTGFYVEKSSVPPGRGTYDGTLQ